MSHHSQNDLVMSASSLKYFHRSPVSLRRTNSVHPLLCKVDKVQPTAVQPVLIPSVPPSPLSSVGNPAPRPLSSQGLPSAIPNLEYPTLHFIPLPKLFPHLPSYVSSTISSLRSRADLRETQVLLVDTFKAPEPLLHLAFHSYT